ncbi:hypothetical protein WH87_02965 [Devosia epidermidihirudinis]|uniref:Transmembrane protein n=1 Tax=Devosia epidermidihirudinis TaxID=1293439 RepID=A0A0F5QIA8_9HYPH|nr:hypothetical protein [Devosia epidermidihirudinis]KKC40717.1 hypothetical protein WH87_02965 [Devosia epidermidihirudinis]
MAPPRTVMIASVNWWWYLAPIIPILAVGYGALISWLPSWALLVAAFAFFMWLFSLLFALFAVMTRKRQPPQEPRQ